MNTESISKDLLKLGLAKSNDGDHIGAIIKYSEAIALCPNKFFLVKRSLSLVAIKKFQLAIDDVKKAIELDKMYRIAYYTLMDIYLLLGDVRAAEEVVIAFRIIAPHINSIDSNQVPKIEKLKEIRADILCHLKEDKVNQVLLLYCLDEALDIAPACVDHLFLKTKCLVALRRFQEAHETERSLNEVLSKYFKIVESLKAYDDGDIEDCMKWLRNMFPTQKLHLPRGIPVLYFFVKSVEKIVEALTSVEKLLSENKAEIAADVASKLLTIDPSNIKLNKKLLLRLSKAFEKIKSLDYSIGFANQMLEIDSKSVDAMMLRLECNFKLKNFEASLADVNKILNLNITKNLRKKLKKRKEEIETAKRGQSQAKDQNENQSPKINSSYAYKKVQDEKVDNRKFFETFHKGENHFKDDLKSEKIFAEADKKNKEGVKEYLAKKYQNALKLFSEAIKLSPMKSIYFYNRSSCHFHMENLKQALADAIKAVDTDDKFYKGYLRVITCFLTLGDFKNAQNYIQRFKMNNSGVDSFQSELEKLNLLKENHEKIMNFCNDQNYEESLKLLETSLEIASSSTEYLELQPRCLIMLDRFDEANEIISKQLAKNPRDVNMLCLQGIQFYFKNELESSIDRFKMALTLDPDHDEAKKYLNNAKQITELYNQGMKHFKENVFYDAQEAFKSAANVDPRNKKVKQSMLYHCGSADFKLERFKNAMESFTIVLRINETHTKSLLKRAQCHFRLSEFEECIIDCEELEELESSEETRNLMEDAKWSLKVNKKDDYIILGVTKTSSVEDIKKQFKKLSLLFHPDKHPEATSVEKKKFKSKFEKIRAAHNFIIKFHDF